ncbi:MAG TPA: deoxyribonuclease IV [Candidatus Saccharimonadales bacterium]|nr:deoxyribonuclease IV [Candidatus Saccharimonadales bacterium]
MKKLGSHMSVEGGLHRSLERGAEAGCDTVQIFTRSSRQWKAPPLAREEIARFRERLGGEGPAPAVAHASYLINMGSPDPALHRRSLSALVEEIDRCELLGLPGLIIHPGAHMGEGVEAGMKRIARCLDAAWKRRPRARVRILLENTAGMGSSVGHTLEQLAGIRAMTREPGRIGFCIDTCHLFAAGYDISTRSGYEATVAGIERILGLDRVGAFHLNDCKGALGCRLDRHEHIGDGGLGITGFWCLMNDPRFEEIPMILETPKGPDLAEDRINLALLRAQAGRKRPVKGPTVGNPGPRSGGRSPRPSGDAAASRRRR